MRGPEHESAARRSVTEDPQQNEPETRADPSPARGESHRSGIGSYRSVTDAVSTDPRAVTVSLSTGPGDDVIGGY